MRTPIPTKALLALLLLTPTLPAQEPPAPPAAPTFKPVPGQRVEAYWVRQWWSATVRQVRGDQVLIRHDQRNGTEEWVPLTALRKFTKSDRYPTPAAPDEIAAQNALEDAARDARLDAARPDPARPRAGRPSSRAPRPGDFVDADAAPPDTSALNVLTDNPDLPLPAGLTPDPEPAPPKTFATRPMPLSGNPLAARASFPVRPTSLFVAPSAGDAVTLCEVPGPRPVQLLQRFDLATGNPSPVAPLESSVTITAVSPDAALAVGVNKFRKGHFGEPPAVEVWSLDKQPKLLACFTPAIGGVDATFVELARFAGPDRVLTLTLGNLICWSVPEAKALYHRKLERTATISLSPTGKYLAAADHQTIRLFDAATGAFLGSLPQADPPVRPSHLSWSPSGKRLLASEPQRLVVFDLDQPAVAADIPLPPPPSASAAPANAAPPALSGGLFLSDQYVLLSGRTLVDLAAGLLLWDYPHGEGPFRPYAGRLLYVPPPQGNHTPVLYASPTLPTPEALAAPKPATPQELYAVLPGTEVSLDLDTGLPADQHAQALNAIKNAIQSAGWILTDTAPTKITASHASANPKDIEYRMFGGSRRTVSVATHTYTLTVRQNDIPLWQTQTSIAPSGFVHLKKDESLEQHLETQRHNSATAFYTSVRLPKRLARPTPTPGLGQTPLPGATPPTPTTPPSPNSTPSPQRPTPTRTRV